MAILIIVVILAMLASLFGYARLRRAYNGVIGVPGSYFATIGLMLTVYMIIGLFQPKTEVGAGIAEIIFTIAVAIIAIGYLVFVMLCKCNTLAQKIFLPFAVVLIAFGWCWRLLGAIFMKIPMQVDMGEKKAAFPEMLRSPDGDDYRKINDSGEQADYECSRTGKRVHFWWSDFEDGCPTGWSSL